MKKVYKILTFILIFIFVYGYLTLVLMPKDFNSPGGKKHYRGIGYISEEKESLQMLIFGNSDAYYGYSPMQFYEKTGVTSYTLAMSKQSLIGIEKQFKESLKYQKPKIVIIETDCFYSINNPVNNDTFEFLSYIFKYHSQWKTLRLKDFYTLPTKMAKDELKGQVFSDSNGKYIYKDYMMNNDKVANMPKKAIVAADNIIEIAEENNIKLLFIGIPSPSSWNYEKHECVKKYLEGKKQTFIDLNVNPELMNIEWDKDYHDNGNHLNYRGATKFTKFVIDYFIKNDLFNKYQLKNVKDDPKYSLWNIQLEKYNKKIANAKKY